MTSAFTKKLIRLHFEIWSAYQLMYCRTATDNTFYDKLFSNSYWNGVRPTFKEVESFANKYWDYKNLIRVAKSKEEVKFILDELEQIGKLYSKFLDTLYLCTSELFRQKYDSIQEAIDEVLYAYDHDEEPDTPDDPDSPDDPDDPSGPDEPDTPIEELEAEFYRTFYSLLGSQGQASVNGYSYELGNAGAVVIAKPFQRMDVSPNGYRPSPYISPAHVYAGTVNKLEVKIQQEAD